MRILQCEFPGCSASVTLTGLPTNGDAQCFLTLKVRITDFSGPEEVVEYIRSKYAWYGAAAAVSRHHNNNNNNLV